MTINYNIWEGRRIEKNGEIFIETKDADWSLRFHAWRKEYISEKGKTSCPCPMPKGHIMFKEVTK